MGEIRRFKYQGEDYLVIPAKCEAFVTLKEWLVSISEELQFPDKTRKHLLISADEIFTNIASYGYPKGGGTAKVTIEFDMNEEILTMVFCDTGVAYNPLEAPAPDIESPLAERKTGGLGIFVVKKLMDVLEYKRADGMNILTMKKKVTRV